MRSVAVSVVIWLALSYIVWCIDTGDGEHLFRRRGCCVKWGAGIGGLLSSKMQAPSTMTAPTKTNGMADASRPLAQMLTVLITSVEPGPRSICNIYFGVWFRISLH